MALEVEAWKVVKLFLEVAKDEWGNLTVMENCSSATFLYWKIEERCEHLFIFSMLFERTSNVDLLKVFLSLETRRFQMFYEFLKIVNLDPAKKVSGDFSNTNQTL